MNQLSLENLTNNQILIFYEIATRLWKFRGQKVQHELLMRINKEGFERLEWTGALTSKEVSFFQDNSPEVDFISRSEFIDEYFEFLGKIDMYVEQCNLELQKKDLERQIQEKIRREAHQAALAEEAERLKLQRVVNAKKAYEEAEKHRYEVYQTLRQGDVSMFDLEFRISSNTPSDEIARLMSQLGRTNVVISPGTWGSAFHTSELCEWLNKGRDRASKFTPVGNLISIGVEEAIYRYKKRPCHSCFMFWWKGEINPHPEFDREETENSEVVEIFLGDPVIFNQGPLEGFEGEVINLLRDDISHVKVRTNSLGRAVEFEVSVDYLDFPEGIEEIRSQRAQLEKQLLERKFEIENEKVRTLEELIILIENGLNRDTQDNLRKLVKEVEIRLVNLQLEEKENLSIEYLLARLNNRIQQAKKQIS